MAHSHHLLADTFDACLALCNSNGNLYLEGLKPPLGYQISAGKWYNLKLIYSDYNKMEFWANGERISTVTYQTR